MAKPVAPRSASLAAAQSAPDIAGNHADSQPNDVPAVVVEIPAIEPPGVEFAALELRTADAAPPFAGAVALVPATDTQITETAAAQPAPLPATIVHPAVRAADDTAFRVFARAMQAIRPQKLTMESAMTTEDLMAFGQANIEAFVKSGQIWAAGVQDLGKNMAASAQAQLDQTMSGWKAIAGVRSVKEAIDMQTGMARAAVEAVVSETGKLTDASMKLSEQTIAPIAARLSVAAEKFGRVPA